MSKPKCGTCGGEDFFTDSGFFFCAECQTQSQDIREEVFDEFYTGQRGNIRALKQPSLKPDSPSIAGKQQDLTSWEVFNYVFKGLVDEIIKLGAKQEVKVIALQLWASYLYKLEVAFTSSNISRKPKLSLNFKLKDAEIIYGVSKERLKTSSFLNRKRKRATSASSESDASTTSISSKVGSLKSSTAKKALAVAEYKQSLSTAIDNESFSQEVGNQTLESLGTLSDHSDSAKSQRIKLTKHTKSLLEYSRIKMTKIKKQEDKNKFQKRMQRSQCTTVHNLSLAKILALLRLALLFSKDDIHIGDILRWTKEGHLSINKCEKYIPDGVKIPVETYHILEPHYITHSGQQTTLMNLCSILDIKDLPTPDLCNLAERYCQELQLPDDFSTIIQSWILHTPVKMISMCTKFEARTMAYLILLLKMIFSLDGITENKLSELALKINRSEYRQEEQKLFVWKDWVEFIECRKAVVSSFHYVTRLSVYKHLPGRDSRLFLDHYEQTISKTSPEGMNEDWRNAVKKTVCQLNEENTTTEVIRFPPTLTPLNTYCRLLTNQYQMELSEIAKRILSQEFTKHSTSFLFNPKSSIALGAICELDILPQSGIANSCVVDQLTETKKTIENFTMNKKNTSVQILTKTIEQNKLKSIKQKNSIVDIKMEMNDFSDIVSDDSSDDNDEDDDDDDDLECSTILGDADGPTSLNETKISLSLYEVRQSYWICHKKFESNDEFNDFAANVFPSTFLWLLKECARVIDVNIRELYEEVMFLESKKNIFTKPSKFLRKRKKLNL